MLSLDELSSPGKLWTESSICSDSVFALFPINKYPEAYSDSILYLDTSRNYYSNLYFSYNFNCLYTGLRFKLNTICLLKKLWIFFFNNFKNRLWLFILTCKPHRPTQKVLVLFCPLCIDFNSVIIKWSTWWSSQGVIICITLYWLSLISE